VRAVLPIPLRSLDLGFDQRMRFWAAFAFSEMSQIATHALVRVKKKFSIRRIDSQDANFPRKETDSADFVCLHKNLAQP